MSSDPVILQAIDKLQEMVMDIQVHNNYYNDIRRCYKVFTSPEDAGGYPYCNIILGDLTYANNQKNEKSNLMKSQAVTLDVWYEAGSEERRQELYCKLLADFETRFLDNTAGGSAHYSMSQTAINLENTINIVLPNRVSQWAIEETNICNFEFELELRFRQNRRNPTQLYT